MSQEYLDNLNHRNILAKPTKSCGICGEVLTGRSTKYCNICKREAYHNVSKKLPQPIRKPPQRLHRSGKPLSGVPLGEICVMASQYSKATGRYCSYGTFVALVGRLGYIPAEVERV